MHKTTPATITKVKWDRKTGEPLFDIKFLELRNQIFTNYNTDYVLMYCDELPLKYHTLQADFIVGKANEAAKSISSKAAGSANISESLAEFVELEGTLFVLF
jgi:hypothetical protein